MFHIMWITVTLFFSKLLVWGDVNSVARCLLFRVLFFFFYKSLFILREGERVCVCMSRGGAERGRQRIQSRLHTISAKPDVGLEPTNHEIMTWVETKSQMLNGATQASHFLESSWTSVRDRCSSIVKSLIFFFIFLSNVSHPFCRWVGYIVTLMIPGNHILWYLCSCEVSFVESGPWPALKNKILQESCYA